MADMQGAAAAPRILSAAAIEPAEIEMLHGKGFVTSREVSLEPQPVPFVFPHPPPRHPCAGRDPCEITAPDQPDR